MTSGNLDRSYRRSPKGAGAEGQVGAGICHRCMCGHAFDWENLQLGVAFLSTLIYI